MTKYQKYFLDMMEENKELFLSFKQIHDKYEENEEEWKDKFNSSGTVVVEKIRMYEKMLCSQTNSGRYSKFSSNLADKFWQAVRSYYPKIDFVGVK